MSCLNAANPTQPSWGPTYLWGATDLSVLRIPRALQYSYILALSCFDPSIESQKFWLLVHPLLAWQTPMLIKELSLGISSFENSSNSHLALPHILLMSHTLHHAPLAFWVSLHLCPITAERWSVYELVSLCCDLFWVRDFVWSIFVSQQLAQCTAGTPVHWTSCIILN